MRWLSGIVFIALLGFAATSFGQAVIKNTNYVEFEIDEKNGEDYIVVPMGERGVLVLMHSTKFHKNNKRDLHATFLNSNLDKVWGNTFVIESNLESIKWTYEEEVAYVLFEKDNNTYFVVRINVDTKATSIFEYSKVKQFYITEFCVIDDKFFFGGEIKNNPAIIRYDPKTDNSLVCPSIHQLDANLVSMQATPDNKTFTAILKSRARKNDFSVFVNTYDIDGKIVNNFSLPQSFEYTLLTYRPLVLNEEETMVLGTYALKSDNNAQGIYVIKLADGNLDALRFYDFGYLKNFFYFLEEKKMEKVLEKVKARREKGKIYPLRYDMFVHDLKLADDQIIFSADVFEPIMEANYSDYAQLGAVPAPYTWRVAGNNQFRSVQHSGGNYRPAAMTKDALNTNNTSSFGFELLNAFACGFDLNGNLLWDNSFSYKDLEVDYPIEVTNVYAEKDSLFIFTAKEEEFFYKTSPYKSFTDSITTDTLAHITQNDRIDEGFENGGIIDWYNNNFLATGIRYINFKRSNDLDRDVFFLYKITCEVKETRIGE